MGYRLHTADAAPTCLLGPGWRSFAGANSLPLPGYDAPIERSGCKNLRRFPCNSEPQEKISSCAERGLRHKDLPGAVRTKSDSTASLLESCGTGIFLSPTRNCP